MTNADLVYPLTPAAVSRLHAHARKLDETGQHELADDLRAVLRDRAWTRLRLNAFQRMVAELEERIGYWRKDYPDRTWTDECAPKGRQEGEA